MKNMAEKIKNNQASQEEISEFTKSFKELMSDVKEGLEK
jgi:hypothetical protein